MARIIQMQRTRGGLFVPRGTATRRARRRRRNPEGEVSSDHYYGRVSMSPVVIALGIGLLYYLFRPSVSAAVDEFGNVSVVGDITVPDPIDNWMNSLPTIFASE